MPKWIVYKDLTYGPRLYYTGVGSKLSYTDPFHWSERLGLAQIFEGSEESMMGWCKQKAKQGNNVEFAEITDKEIFLARLKG